MQSLTIDPPRKRTPSLSVNSRAELIASCNGASIKTLLTAIAQAVRDHGGLWERRNIAIGGTPVVEIEVFGVVAYGKDGPQTCRNWMIEAAKQRGRAA